jgi:hypothetical protein
MKWKNTDMSITGGSLKIPGRYLAEVKEVREKKTKYGDNMWSIHFCDAESGGSLCWDNLSFGPKGRGIAFKKLSLLGVPKDDQDFFEIEDKDDLEGNRCYLNLVEETYEGKTDLKPDFHSDGFGYEPGI